MMFDIGPYTLGAVCLVGIAYLVGRYFDYRINHREIDHGVHNRVEIRHSSEEEGY